jgi:hypothetical protein
VRPSCSTTGAAVPVLSTATVTMVPARKPWSSCRAVDVERAVLADPATGVRGERGRELVLVDRTGDGLGPLLRRRAAEQPAMGHTVVMLAEERQEAGLHVVQRRHRAEVVEAALAQRAPEPLHLAARRCVVGLGVDQRDLQALARQLEHVAAVGRAIVEVHRVGAAVAAQRAEHQVEHVVLALGVVRFERDHVARGVVEQRVDAERLGRLADPQRRAVADVAVPQRARMLGLPAQPGMAARARAARQLGIAVEPGHRRDRHRALGDPAVEHERARDQCRRRAGVLAPDVEQERALLGRQLAGTTAIGARVGPERLESTASVGVDPALERRHAVLPGGAPTGRPVRALGELAKLGGELATVQLTAGERADDLGAKQGNRLGVVAGNERIGHGSSIGHGG